MTKADIVGRIQEHLNLNLKQSTEIVDLFFETIKETLASGYDLKISGFGNFCLKDKGPRKGRNPQSGEEIAISARRVLTFKPGQTLKKRLNGQTYFKTGEITP